MATDRHQPLESVHNEARDRPTLEHRGAQRIGQLVSLGQGETGPIRVLQVTGDDFRPWVLTCSLTAAYSNALSPEPGGARMPALIAVLNFGVDGTSQKVFLNVSRGVQISVPATGLDLSVQRVLTGNFLDDGPVQISGQLSYGAHPAGSQQPVLEAVASFPAVPPGPAATALLRVAPFARAVTLLSDDLGAFAGATAIGIEALDGSSTPVVLARYAPTAPFNSQPLPAGACFLRLSSPPGAGARVVRALYELAL